MAWVNSSCGEEGRECDYVSLDMWMGRCYAIGFSWVGDGM